MTQVSANAPILLYGVLAADAGIEGTGLHDAPLTRLSCGELAVLASPLEDPSALRQPEADTVLAYKETVDAAYEEHPLVPLRFGTWADGAGEARTLVTERADAFRTQLDRLSGRVEMGVRLTLNAASKPADDARNAASGAAYLRARKQQHDRTRKPLDEAFEQYREVLASLFVDATAGRPHDGTLSVAFLVPRPDAGAFARRASEVRPGARVEGQVVGPWAPFTFASLSF